LHIHTPPLFIEKDGWEQLDMLWCQGVQNIGLSVHKLKSAVKCTVIWSQCTPVPDRQTDRQTDEHHERAKSPVIVHDVTQIGIG